MSERSYTCEAPDCGTELSHDEYVAVGPSTPLARELGFDDPSRDHFVLCDDCFESAVGSFEQS